jgi:hypothetical protein
MTEEQAGRLAKVADALGCEVESVPLARRGGGRMLRIARGGRFVIAARVDAVVRFLVDELRLAFDCVRC